MDPTLLLTHAVVAVFALVAGLFIGQRSLRRRPASQAWREGGSGDEVQALRTEVETLRPLVWKVASLEGAVATHESEVAHIRSDAAAQIETYRQRLAETEWMTIALQQALVAAKPPESPRADRQAGTEAGPSEGAPQPSTDSLSAKLEELRARIDELSQTGRPQHPAREG
jgi:hypothetical protein